MQSTLLFTKQSGSSLKLMQLFSKKKRVLRSNLNHQSQASCMTTILLPAVWLPCPVKFFFSQAIC